MLARSKSGATKQWRQRNTRSARESVELEGQQPQTSSQEPSASSEDATGDRPLPGGTGSPQTTSAQSRRRREPAPQDVALYSCQCGFVFQAAVSTSVGCPNCGDAQAW